MQRQTGDYRVSNPQSKQIYKVAFRGIGSEVLSVPVTKEQMEMHDEFQFTVTRLVHKWRHQGFLSENDRKHLLLASARCAWWQTIPL